MNEAADLLVGQHDFASFCRKRKGATTIRTLLNVAWSRPAPHLAELEITADAFCHSMVRALVGAMLNVGDGRRDLDWLSGTSIFGCVARASLLQPPAVWSSTMLRTQAPPKWPSARALPGQTILP